MNLSVVAALGNLYRSASYLHRDQFRYWALRLLDQTKSFDAAVWAAGQIGRPLDLSSALAVGVPAEFVAEPGPAARLFDEACRMDGTESSALRQVATKDLDWSAREHHIRFGIQSGVYTAHFNRLSGVVNVIAVFNFRHSKQLSDESQQLVRALTHAIVDAASFCFFLHLSNPAWLDKRKAAAICTQEGLLLECQPRFLATLKDAYPTWHGPELPFRLGHVSRENNDLMIEVDPFERLIAVRLWKRSEVDGLTTREQQLVSRAITGHTDKEIALALGLAPSTVSNRLMGACKKLKVSGRQELRKKYQEWSDNLRLASAG